MFIFMMNGLILYLFFNKFQKNRSNSKIISFFIWIVMDLIKIKILKYFLKINIKLN